MPDSSGTRSWRRAASLVLMIVWLVVPMSMAYAQTSSPQPLEASAMPSGVSASSLPFPIAPGTSAVPGGLPWQGVVPPFRASGRSMSHLTPWRAGFAAVELVEASERMVALWHSSDGMSWRRDALPTGLRRGVWDLVAFRDQLVLVRGATALSPETIRHELWATSDGRRWHPLGDFRTSLDARLRPDWRLGLSAIEATDDTLLLFAQVIPCCGSGGWRPGAAIASIDSIAAAQQQPYGGLLVWTSPDGARWTRHRARGFTDSDGKAYLDQLAADGAGGLLATRLGGEAAVLGSPDGVHWTVVAPLPELYEEGGSQGLIVPTGGLMVFGDAGDGDGFGNPLGAWSLESRGEWLRVIDQQPAFTRTQAAAGETIIVVGSSWDRWDRRWPWIFVSLDGGGAWDAGLSWSGSDGGCLGDVVVRDRTAVMVGCQDGEPAMWATQLPGSLSAPTAQWGPMAITEARDADMADVGVEGGRLVIGERCVTIRAANGANQARTTLVFREGQVRWDPERERIRFHNKVGGWVWLEDGELLGSMGGWNPWADTGPGPGIPAWVVQPNPACPADRVQIHEISKPRGPRVRGRSASRGDAEAVNSAHRWSRSRRIPR